tara:strand:- start:641 stop:874 length:234 start_codon:yes stop_codon:yes gene_type:complete
MNDLTVLLYLIMFAIIVGTTFAFMYTMMKSTLREVNSPRRKVHPEMEDVKTGDELLVFNLDEEDEDDNDGDVMIVRR